MKKILAAVIAFAVVIIPQTQVNAENSANELKVAQLPEELTPEDIYAYLWDQTVVTVSRREQKISEAPASVTVITADDIKRSGALNIHELLRPVAGMDVVGLTQTGPAVSIRGFNTALVSRTILVLLNGNPLYQEINMSPMWGKLPINLQEIERIEIVRGPGSALWGANAYSGVMNIITKTPDKFPSLQVNQSVGDLGTTYTNLGYARQTGNLQYRLDVAHEEMLNVTLNPGDTAIKRNVYKADLLYKTPEQKELSLQFGYTHPHSTLLNPTGTMFEMNHVKEYVHAAYKTKNSIIKIRQNSTHWLATRQSFPYQPASPNPASDKSISAEVQTTKKFRRWGILTYGTEYKFVEGTFLGPERTQGLGSFFAQHDIAVNKKVSFITGARMDTHPQVKTAVSPRASLMYMPGKKHTLRITGATSYRRPSYTELYANGLLSLGSSLVQVIGSESIKAERIQSLEFGYTGKMSEGIKLSATFYRNILDNFISMVPSGPARRFVNRNKATQNGAEIELETMLTRYIKAFTNYSYNDTKDTSKTKSSPMEDQVEMSPRHKVNAGLGWIPLKGPYGNLVFNFVDETGQTILGKFQRVDPYRNVDVNFGYRCGKKLEGLELALGAQNVFNKKRKEHPAGDTFKRRVVGSVSYAF